MKAKSYQMRLASWILMGIFATVLGGFQTTIIVAQHPSVKKSASEQEQGSHSHSGKKTSEKKARILFDGKSLDGWETVDFAGHGECEVSDGLITLRSGEALSGFVSTLKDLPKTNYEISLRARKTEGNDFFCGLTFPVATSHCTFIVGGWGGAVVGLSSIDDEDAARNETRKFKKFNQDQWYKIRVRVEPNKISAWIDDKQMVDQNIENRKISLRGDTKLCAPLGLCTFQTSAQYKDIKIRAIGDADSTKPDSSPTNEP